LDLHNSISCHHHLDLAIRKTKIQDEKIEGQDERLVEQQKEIETQRDEIEIQRDEMKKLQREMSFVKEKMDSIVTLIKSPDNPIFSNTHEWKVYQFWDKFGRAGNKGVQKPLTRHFYTEKGHKLKAGLYLNGLNDDLGEAVSIYFQTDNGNFDDSIAWPMRAKIYFGVVENGHFGRITKEIDTKDNKSSFKRNNTDGSSFGDSVIPHSFLQLYVVNDIFTIQIKVEYYY